MDGFKGRIKDPLKNSLRTRLSFWLSVVIVLIAIIAGTFAFFNAQGEANELQDETLRQVASLFDEHHLPLPPSGTPRVLSEEEEDARVVVQQLRPQGQTTANTDMAVPGLPDTLADGLQTITAQQEDYRVLVKTLSSGQRIAVSQETDIRDEIASESALRTLLPFLVLVPVLLVVVAVLVRHMFKLIAELSQEIDQREDHELHPIKPESLPTEIRPFLVAINRLLGRVGQSMDAQRRFVADAAHELRSPLTALSLQAERLGSAPMSDAAQERLLALRGGIQRTRQLLDQLLTLARVQDAAHAQAESAPVQQTFRHVLEDLLPLAEAKNIDIGVVGETEAEVRMHPAELHILLKNLVDNAIRYTPAGGRIDLSVTRDAAAVTVEIEDTGPGIPEHERDRVFDPFYRVLGSDETGSGLGLSIVQAIVERAGATIVLEEADTLAHSGLRVRITFLHR
ncbi:sensor histidine kinase [Silvimonas iriomotensis]|uniref:histidine kinase n=1 Tax=Silvimonas iriomotensis TaxID=449662 RepID=A0ABQ2PBA8_9NEIS|nr:HAMP domain-containing sensor histidine kinase [Silvimonas iriomotensis]GGP22691.1 two-component sensor histidine kinase [Silvimonas iriomotensis]